MSSKNRQRSRPNHLRAQPKNGVSRMGDAIKEALEKSRADMLARAEAGNVNDDFDLPMPDFQDLKNYGILWTWEFRGGRVLAEYNNESRQYTVSIDSDTSRLHDLSGEESKELGQVLCSAYKWETAWQSNAGVYLANGGRLPEEKPVDLFDDDDDEDDELGGESINRG